MVFLCVCVFHLMLAGRQLFGVLRWFQLFCFFHLVSLSAVCLPDQGSHFSFATSICGLLFLSLSQAFVHSLFLSWPFLPQVFMLDFLSLPCYHLFQGIRVSLRFWCHAVHFLLISFILGDSNLNFSPPLICSIKSVVITKLVIKVLNSKNNDYSLNKCDWHSTHNNLIQYQEYHTGHGACGEQCCSCFCHQTTTAQFCKPISRHPRGVISCREQEAALIFMQELYLHFSR